MSKRLKLECGCDFQDYGMGLALDWCPLHKAAPELLEALAQAESAIEDLLVRLPYNPPDDQWVSMSELHYARNKGRKALTAIRAAIAKATEGDDVSDD